MEPCAICGEEIEYNEPYMQTKSYRSCSYDCKPTNSDWWNFHINCWLKLMENANVVPTTPFPTFKGWPKHGD